MSITYGSEQVFNSNQTDGTAVTNLDTTHIVVAYVDDSDSDKGKAKVGTISGNTISWGSAYEFNSGGGTGSRIDIISLSSSKIAVVFRDSNDSNKAKAIIGDISGTTITFGSEQEANAGASFWVCAAYLDSTHFAIGYSDWGNGFNPTVRIATVSGTSISFGSEYTISVMCDSLNITATDSTHVVLAYQDYDDSNYGKGVVGTISGNSISWGTSVQFSGDTVSISIAKLDSTHIVVAYVDQDESDKGNAAVGTISGSTISWGSEATYNNGSTVSPWVSIDSSSRVVVGYKDAGDANKGKAIIGDISGTTITFGSEDIFNNASTDYIGVISYDTNKVAITYKDNDNSYYGTGIIGTLPSSGPETYQEEIDSDASIQGTLSNTIDSDSKIILGTYGETIDSDAMIKKTGVQDTIYSDTSIKQTGNQETIYSDANITTSELEYIDSDAHIKQSWLQENINADALIQGTVQETIQSSAIIYGDDLQENIISDAYIVSRVQENIESDTYFKYFKDFNARLTLESDTYSDFNTQLKVNQDTPVDPTGLTATDLYTGEAIELSWTDTGNYGYNVYLDVGGSWVKQNDIVILESEYVVGGLTANVTYTFKVVGVNGVDDESSGVTTTGTPTYNLQTLATVPDWKIYIDGVENTDAILDRVELVYGPEMSIADFHIKSNPSTSGLPDADKQSVVIYINDRKVFTGDLVKRTNIYNPTELRVNYQALSSLWQYSRYPVTNNFNEFAKPWESVSNHTVLIYSGCPWALPYRKIYGPVNVAGYTKLDLMDNMATQAGNYKIHCDENGNVSYYRIGNAKYTRTLEVGKHILNQNLSVDKSDTVGQVRVHSDYERVTAYKEISYDGIEGAVRLDVSYYQLPTPIEINLGYNQKQIQDVQVFARMGQPPRVTEYLTDIELQPGHCYEGVTSTVLTKWADGDVTEDGEVSYIAGSEGRYPVKSYEEFEPEWQSFPATVEYAQDGQSATVKLQGTPVAYNTKISLYTAKFYSQDGSGNTVESTLPVYIWNKPTAYATEIVIVYSYLANRMSSSYGSSLAIRSYYEGVQPYSIDLPSHIDSLYMPGVARSNLSEVQSYLTSKAISEYLRLSQDDNRGSITIIGDETLKLRTKVNDMEVVRVTHEFTPSSGFLTHLDLTTEQFYFGQEVFVQQETKKVKDSASRVTGMTRSLYYDNEKLEKLVGILRQPGVTDTQSGTAHYSE